MLLLRVQVQSLNYTHSNCSTKDPVSFHSPTPSSPTYTHPKRYFQDNGWVLDISRIIMFSVSWFARNTAIVIYNNYLNDNGSNNDNTRKTRILRSIKKKSSNTMLVEEKSRSTCQKYKKTYSHIATKTIFSANVMALSAAVRVYNLKLSFYCSIFIFARTVQYLFFHQGNYGYNFIINMGHISMP